MDFFLLLLNKILNGYIELLRWKFIYHPSDLTMFLKVVVGKTFLLTINNIVKSGNFSVCHQFFSKDSIQWCPRENQQSCIIFYVVSFPLTSFTVTKNSRREHLWIVLKWSVNHESKENVYAVNKSPSATALRRQWIFFIWADIKSQFRM